MPCFAKGGKYIYVSVQNINWSLVKFLEPAVHVKKEVGFFFREIEIQAIRGCSTHSASQAVTTGCSTHSAPPRSTSSLFTNSVCRSPVSLLKVVVYNCTKREKNTFFEDLISSDSSAVSNM